MNFAISKVAQGVVLLAALLLTACGGGATGGGGNPPGNPAPTISSTSPANNATSVATNAAIAATFSEAMTASTVIANFTLKDSQTSASVAGAVTCNGTTATFTPSSVLASSTQYTATITTGAKSAVGTAMAFTYPWTFTTGTTLDTIPPTVSSVFPDSGAMGVATNSAISATFSESMNATAVTATGNFTLQNAKTGASVAGTVTYRDSGLTANLTPSSPLATSTLYTATVTRAVTDLAGNAIPSDKTWSFTTGAAADTTPPTVSITSPTNGTTGVSVNSVIAAVFSEYMDTSTVTKSNFTLQNGATSVAGTVTYSGTTATFTPASALANGTTYTATISTGVKDAGGNAMASARTWSFTTATGVTAPSITTQPQSTSVATGQQATFSVVASGSAPLSYQWKKGTGTISGATSSSYTTPATALADNGAQFTVVVGNSAGNATSSAAVLTVHDVQPVKNGSRYLSGSILSAITPTVATSLKAVFAQGKLNGLKDDVFFKVGDSISAGPQDYLYQFTYPAYDPATMYGWDDAHDLGNYQSLRGAHDYFLTGRIGTDDPYQRTSVAAKVGQVASWALGIQSGQTDHPLQTELQTTQGAYSVIMFGTNNFYPWNPASDSTDAATYQEIVENTFRMLDYCVANGSVPILTAPPPDPVEVTAMKRSRMTSRLLRAAAQGRQIPFIDYYASLLDLPGYGLQANDVHPNAMAYNRFAFLTTAGLQYGYNMRNLVTLQSLDRMYRLLVLNGAAPDAETGGLQGSGSAADPFVIDGLDFSDYQMPANGATSAYYKLTVANGGGWQLAGAGQAAAVSGIEIRNGTGGLVGSNGVGVLAPTLAAGTYTIKVIFPASIGGFVFAALANSGR
jgi:hypothetical protein